MWVLRMNHVPCQMDFNIIKSREVAMPYISSNLARMCDIF